jgi:hypothetical protein
MRINRLTAVCAQSRGALEVTGSSKFWIEAGWNSLPVLTNLRLFVECEVIGEGLLG